MNLTILDPHVSSTMNVFLTIANIINLIYNIPQMVKTYKTKSTKDFSAWFIFLRIFGNIIWIIYAIEIDSLQMLINNTVTVIASVFIGYYKFNEILSDYRNKHYTLIENIHTSDDELMRVADGLMHVDETELTL